VIWYKDKEMKRLVWLLVPLFLPLALASQERIEKIEIVGNDRVTPETILYYLTSREGDYFNEDSLRKDFRVLWSTGFFSNLKIEGEEGLEGKVVKITVEENPVIKSITYKTGKKVKEDDIVNKLKEKDEYVLPYSYYSSAKVQKVKETIIDLLLEKGLYAAKVDVQTERKGKNEMDLLFKIDEGPKVRVGEVIFAGRPKIPQSELQLAMKSNRSHSFFSWIGGKDVYKENKLQEDLENIRAKFQENGYMEATVDAPRIEEMTRRTVFMNEQKMMRLIFPVNAGYRYSVGEVTVEGSKAVSLDYLRSLIKLRKGEVYSTKIREKAVTDIGDAYRNVGYLYAQIMPIESLDPKNKRVNVAYNIYEGEVAYLSRLEFRGNNYTKDKVIRREMLLREGDRFSLALFKDSILRIKQLGLVDLEKEPDI
jgi:outer membrane protein insertion porin family